MPPDWTRWDQVATDHRGFGPAFESLVGKGCDKDLLFELLGEMSQAQPVLTRDDFAKVRKGLRQGIEALRQFADIPWPIDEVRFLKTSLGDLWKAQQTLVSVEEELRPFERKSDLRKSDLRDHWKRILVRYVRRITGSWRDREVAEIINGALAPMPNFGAEDEYDEQGRLVDITSYRLPDDPWTTYSPEAHRRWRRRNKKLIDEPPALEEQWEQDLKRRAEQRNEPKPQRLRALR